MGKFEDAVRAEVLRLVRRELRQQLVPLAKAVRELRRTLSQTQKELAQLGKRVPKPEEAAPVSPTLDATEEEIAKFRMSADTIRVLRRRLGITQVELATLAGVTRRAVKLWERGATTRPRGKTRSAIVALRKLSREQAVRLLAAHQSEAVSAGAPRGE